MKEKPFTEDVFGNDIFMARSDEITKEYGNVKEILRLISPFMGWKDDGAHVYVSDMSELADFGLTAENLKTLSKKLGFAVEGREYIYEIAKKMADRRLTPMSTEPKLGTCDNVKRPHSYLDGTHEWLTGAKRNVCVNWREVESAPAQPDYREAKCSNCARQRVQWSGICEKCLWDNDKGNYASITGRCPHSPDGEHKPIPGNNILVPPFMECEYCHIQISGTTAPPAAPAQPDTTKHFCTKFDWCVLKPDHPGSCSSYEFMMSEAVPPAAETARNLENAEKKLAENGIIWEEGTGYVFDGKS